MKARPIGSMMSAVLPTIIVIIPRTKKVTHAVPQTHMCRRSAAEYASLGSAVTLSILPVRPTPSES